MWYIPYKDFVLFAFPGGTNNDGCHYHHDDYIDLCGGWLLVSVAMRVGGSSPVGRQ